ncbi:MAG: enoyl-CoA hydratase/isomerase family protein [Deltaproteobacteria bacterium]|nr:enoyl-CoA hydratase/isomerase family protein [Deltaproteobacteria bacterium]
MKHEDVLTEIIGPLGKITFNRPEVFNAYRGELAQQLRAAVETLIADKQVRVMVITGAGKAFMSGADINMINEFTSRERPEDIASYLDELFDPNTLEDAPKPTIAAVNGIAYGMGLEIALACDYRIASEKARFALPEIKLGLIPGGGGSQRLIRLLGEARALEMITTGEPVDAQQALALGLVNQVVPPERLWESVEGFAGDLACKGGAALRACKRLIYEGGSMPTRHGIAYERDLFCQIVLSEDAAEGTEAFLQKRKPVFKQD